MFRLDADMPYYLEGSSKEIMDASNPLPNLVDFLRKNPLSRIAHCVLVMAFIIVLAVSAVSAVKFGSKNNDISENSVYGDSDSDDGTCILYAKYRTANEQIELGSKTACDTAISGEAVALVTALVLMVFSAVEAGLGIHM